MMPPLHQCQEPIAITGAACRFAGEASSPEGLWEMLQNARTGRSIIPKDRWNAEDWYHPDPDRRGAIHTIHGCFLEEDVSLFDAPFFSITAKEAACMDPMKRLLLEVSYESLENAGIPVESLLDSQTGCYVGNMTNDYEMLSTRDPLDIGPVAASATSEAMTANRISWFYGLRGPSVTLDTACSSSLYALHLACQSLRAGETDMNLVGGVNLILHPNFMTQLSDMHMLSPEGISHSFDSRANGYARGEGIACLVVKRLSDAVRDGDNIRAVIRATGANADGRTPSITTPSADAQADLIRRTYAAAGLDLAGTQYFEAHGTGTLLGDPIEVSAIASTLGACRGPSDLPLYVGSIKGNVAHTEGCSGLAGVLKAVMCLENGVMVPTVGVQKVNPKLKLDEWRLALVPETMPWPTPGQRRVSVNSFGFGGANAHAILDDAYHYLLDRGIKGNHCTVAFPQADYSASDSGVSLGGSQDTPQSPESRCKVPLLLPFSAQHKSSLDRLVKGYHAAVGSAIAPEDPLFLQDLAYTLTQRRSQLELRTFAVADSARTLASKLNQGLAKATRASKLEGAVFVFTGQGAQWAGMGMDLLAANAGPARASLEETQRILVDLGCDWNVATELARPAAESNVDKPQYSQVLCTALQLALVDLLREWEIRPRATVGHSSGEIAAAYASGVLTHRDAVKIAYSRGICSAAVRQRGAMLAAGCSHEQALEYINRVCKGSRPGGVAVVACINSPDSVTLSGDWEVIDELAGVLVAEGRFARKLRVQTAYHSPHMEPLAQRYLDEMGLVETASLLTIPMFSSVTGRAVADSKELGPEYWVRNMCGTVRFSDALETLLTTSPNTGAESLNARWGPLLEIGPHGALQGPIGDILGASRSRTARDSSLLSVLSRGKSAVEAAMEAAGKLWSLGLPVNLSRVNGGSSDTVASTTDVAMGRLLTRPKLVPNLPSYPWHHARSYWCEGASARSARYPAGGPRTDLLGVATELFNPAEPVWRNHLRLSENPWIQDHCITGTVLYPAAGMLVMVMEGLNRLADGGREVRGFRFRSVSFERGLLVPSTADSSVETRLAMRPAAQADEWSFTIYSLTATTQPSWTRHCSGLVALEYAADLASGDLDEGNPHSEWNVLSRQFDQIHQSQDLEAVDVEEFYEGLSAVGMEYGPLFRNVTRLNSLAGSFTAVGDVQVPDTASSMPMNHEYPPAAIHPAALDSVFHLLLAAINDGTSLTEAAVPFYVDNLFVASAASGGQPATPGHIFRGFARRTSFNGRESVADLMVSDEKSPVPRIIARGFVARKIGKSHSSDAVSDSAGGPDDEGSSCASVVWKEDVCLCRSGDQSIPEGFDLDSYLVDWVDKLCFKQSGLDVLLVDPSSRCAHEMARRVGKRECGIRSIMLLATSESERTRLCRSEQGLGSKFQIQLLDRSNHELGNSVYDLVVEYGTNDSPLDLLDHLRTAVKPGGYLARVGPTEKRPAEYEEAELQDLVTLQGPDTTGLSIHRRVRPATTTELPKSVYLLTTEAKFSPDASSNMVTNMTSLLTSLGVLVELISVGPELGKLKGKHVISLVEAQRPWIVNWSEKDLTDFQSLMRVAPRHLFWVTRGGLMDGWSAPCGIEFAPTQGLLRVMRTEYPHVVLPHLDVSGALDIEESDAGARLLLDVWLETLAPASAVDGRASEMEFAEKNGRVYIPRLLAEKAADAVVDWAQGRRPAPSKGPLHCGVPLHLQMGPGDDEQAWIDDDRAALPLSDGEVQVGVSFVGLGGCDVLDDGTSRPGSEAVGIVERVASDVTTLRPGQTVMVLDMTQSCLRTHVTVQSFWCVPIPDGVEPSEAAGLGPLALIAAQYALTQVARLERGQRVLIHAAAGGLGQAAIQVATSLGAEIWATVSSPEKRDLLVQQYGIPKGCIFDSKTSGYAAGIAHATAGQGVDVVVGSRPDHATMASLECLADFGVYVDLSRGTTSSSSKIPASKSNASYCRLDVAKVLQARPTLAQALLAKAASFRHARPLTLYQASEARQALARLATRAHYGKIVLSLDKEAQVLSIPRPPPDLTLDPRGVYILAGGLGALGLSIAAMMLARGARHLVFLSRSGRTAQTAERLDRLVADNPGCKIETLRCNVCEEEQVRAAIDSVSSTREQPIKGIVQ
ncbi:Type I Iterative PKS [Pyricularia oryzae]|nr:Type I Iterative PKS [Pyricularia oryzae]